MALSTPGIHLFGIIHVLGTGGLEPRLFTASRDRLIKAWDVNYEK